MGGGSRPSQASSPPASAASGSEVAPSSDPNADGVVDRVKAVPRRDLLKRRRLELSPHTGVSLNDPYFVHLEFGGTLVFYPHDNFGIGIGADYFYAHPRTTNVDAVRLGLTSVLATFDLPVLMAHLDFYWLPIYGKVSVFNSWIVNFDLYASAGVGVATAFGTHTPMEANIAIGSHYALTQWLAIRAEVREHMFVDTQVANNIPRSSVQSYTMFLLGVSFFVPPTFEYSFQ